MGFVGSKTEEAGIICLSNLSTVDFLSTNSLVWKGAWTQGTDEPASSLFPSPRNEDSSSDQDSPQPIHREPAQFRSPLENPSATIVSALQVEVRTPRFDKVYRARGIPYDYDRIRTIGALESILGLCNTGGLTLGSFATSPYCHERVATISFRKTPPCLRSGDEWRFNLSEFGNEVIRAPLSSHQIVIDSHFRDFTPLRTFESESDHLIE
jgi:hypothetical protein